GAGRVIACGGWLAHGAGSWEAGRCGGDRVSFCPGRVSPSTEFRGDVACFSTAPSRNGSEGGTRQETHLPGCCREHAGGEVEAQCGCHQGGRPAQTLDAATIVAPCLPGTRPDCASWPPNGGTARPLRTRVDRWGGDFLLARESVPKEDGTRGNRP